MEPIRGKTEIIDQSHRYNMRKIIIKREKTKTAITNLNDIASDLKIPDPNLIVLFIKNKLSISITFKNDRAILSNDIEEINIKNALYDFIEYFVLCKKCTHPELTYFLENKKLCSKCTSCGALNFIESNDSTDKVIKHFETILSKKTKKIERKKKPF